MLSFHRPESLFTFCRVILVDVFVSRVLAATPELEAADIEETIENNDGTMLQLQGDRCWFKP